MSDRPILQVWGAEHRFDDRMILRGVDLKVRQGEIYALLGPNGAGKSTLVRAVCGRLKLTGGEVALDDKDPWSNPAARRVVGVVPQDLALYPHLTVRENLETFGRLSGVKGRALQDAVRQALRLTRTEDREHAPVGHLSGGYKRRVNIGAAILHQPKLLILDEPTVGVDIDARAALDSVIRALRDMGTAVLVVTHDLDQAGGLADRVGFLREGRKVLEGAPHALIEQAFGAEMEILVELSVEADAATEAALAGEGLTRREGDGLWTRLDAGGYAAAGRLDKRLRRAGVVPREIRVREPSLQNLFTLVAEWRRAA
ncbi:ABC transporter ATP-binding protein [Caulobacter mirabilis]|uniref:ABC transporter n=1 Tax=Caulobacter mirabilis TaxID=69666 RepID=A0A2D2AWJ6_9CAUL|nr:ABC transporter ATP-binding protein [Caulobacter mirabilis]ATQ42379.1 ABC transporter [Caulobacter mirabilis]